MCLNIFENTTVYPSPEILRCLDTQNSYCIVWKEIHFPNPSFLGSFFSFGCVSMRPHSQVVLHFQSLQFWKTGESLWERFEHPLAVVTIEEERVGKSWELGWCISIFNKYHKEEYHVSRYLSNDVCSTYISGLGGLKSNGSISIVTCHVHAKAFWMGWTMGFAPL